MRAIRASGMPLAGTGAVFLGGLRGVDPACSRRVGMASTAWEVLGASSGSAFQGLADVATCCGWQCRAWLHAFASNSAADLGFLRCESSFVWERRLVCGLWQHVRDAVLQAWQYKAHRAGFRAGFRFGSLGTDDKSCPVVSVGRLVEMDFCFWIVCCPSLVRDRESLECAWLCSLDRSSWPRCLGMAGCLGCLVMQLILFGLPTFRPLLVLVMPTLRSVT